MQISDQEAKLVQNAAAAKAAPKQSLLESKPEDAELIRAVTKSVMEMGDREALVAELKARVEAGTYRPTGDEIVDAMVRRSMADQIR